jgi:hypothetical protein
MTVTCDNEVMIPTIDEHTYACGRLALPLSNQGFVHASKANEDLKFDNGAVLINICEW